MAPFDIAIEFLLTIALSCIVCQI